MSRDGRGGTGAGALLSGSIGSKNVSKRPLSSFGCNTPVSDAGSPMSTRASLLESWLGFSLRRAFCVAARAEGEGGRGAGFIACATVRGIVGILQDDTTGSEKTYLSTNHYEKDKQAHTGEVSVNRSLHESLHPFSNDHLLLRAEEMRRLAVVNNPESIFSRIRVLVRNYFIPLHFDVSFNFRLLYTPHPSAHLLRTAHAWNSPNGHYFANNTSGDPSKQDNAASTYYTSPLSSSATPHDPGARFGPARSCPAAMRSWLPVVMALQRAVAKA